MQPGPHSLQASHGQPGPNHGAHGGHGGRRGGNCGLLIQVLVLFLLYRFYNIQIDGVGNLRNFNWNVGSLILLTLRVTDSYFNVRSLRRKFHRSVFVFPGSEGGGGRGCGLMFLVVSLDFSLQFPVELFIATVDVVAGTDGDDERGGAEQHGGQQDGNIVNLGLGLVWLLLPARWGPTLSPSISPLRPALTSPGDEVHQARLGVAAQGGVEGPALGVSLARSSNTFQGQARHQCHQLGTQYQREIVCVHFTTCHLVYIIPQCQVSVFLTLRFILDFGSQIYSRKLGNTSLWSPNTVNAW